MVSAWVYESRLPPTAQVVSGPLLAVMLGVPALSLLALVGVRLAARGPTSVVGDRMVLWLMVFGLALHLAVLGDALGNAPPLSQTVPWAVSGLLIGLGLWMRVLPHGDAMGLRAAPWLASEAAWRQGHHVTGWLLIGVGALTPLAAWLGS